MRVAVVTDSTANLPKKAAADLGITVVPLQVLFGNQSYRDGVDLEAEQFYRMMIDSKELPTTSQPSTGLFVEAFTSLLKDHDAIVGVFISAKLSGTLRSAESARALVGGDITLVDSEKTEYALGMQVIAAAKLAQSGAEPAEMVERMNQVRQSANAYIVVDSLENLRRGGRIGGAAALLGSLLQIKPIITLQNGIVEVHEKVRTYGKAVDRIVDKVATDAESGHVREVTVIYTTDRSAAIDLQQRVQKRMPQTPTQLLPITPVVGVHAGAGSVGVIYDKAGLL